MIQIYRKGLPKDQQFIILTSTVSSNFAQQFTQILSDSIYSDSVLRLKLVTFFCFFWLFRLLCLFSLPCLLPINLATSSASNFNLHRHGHEKLNANVGPRARFKV